MTKFSTCPLCEAICGIAVEVDGNRIQSVRGDTDDPLSRGYICPKAAALPDIHDDPDRVRQPLKRVGSNWQAVEWDDALDEIADRLIAIQKRGGKDAVAMYGGNPTVHSYSGTISGLGLIKALGTRNFYTASSVDTHPRLFISAAMYGSQVMIPIPDLRRTEFLMIIGANPVVSNGSLMTAPGFRDRLKAIQNRGGHVVVIDPRRTETARAANEHHFVKPGSDALLLISMLHVIFREGWSNIGRLRSRCVDIDHVRHLAQYFSPERVTDYVGIPANAITDLARRFANARRAACYGRIGTCTQRFGTLTTWLIDLLNLFSGNLDEPGGMMFPQAAVELDPMLRVIGRRGVLGRRPSRVSGYPDIDGELPVAALTEEIETPGRGQIRGLICYAGNPVLSTPAGPSLERALQSLELMVSIDLYVNETSRHADFILPTSFGLEHDHYPLLFHSLAVHNTAKYSPALLQPPSGVRHDWQVLNGLARRMVSRRIPGLRFAERLLRPIDENLNPRKMLAIALKRGPWKLDLEELAQDPHGIDLGPLTPQLPERLRNGQIQLCPGFIAKDMQRLQEFDKPAGAVGAKDQLQLISRRELRSNNSWMHNSRRLTKGKHPCALLIHPADAKQRAISDGDTVAISAADTTLEVAVEISDEMMPGVVCLPHGWGHSGDGLRLSVASSRPGVNVNAFGVQASTDAPSGCSSFSDVWVTVKPAAGVATHA